jgi:O-antigen ligase
MEGLGANVYSMFRYHSIFGSTLPRAILIGRSDRIDGLIGDPNFHGIYAGMLLLFSLAGFFAYKSKIIRAGFVFAVLIALFNIIGAASRGPVLSLSIAFIVFAHFLELPRKWLKFGALLLFSLLLGIAMLAVIPDLDIERFYKAEGKAARTVEIRRDNILMGLDMFEDHPFIGHGPGGFYIDYHRYSIRYPSSQKAETIPLNLYIQVLADFGLLGLSLLLAFLLIIFLMGFRMVRLATGERKLLALGVWTTFVAYIIFMNFTGRLADQYFWLAAALVVAATNVLQPNEME